MTRGSWDVRRGIQLTFAAIGGFVVVAAVGALNVLMAVRGWLGRPSERAR